MPHKPTPHQLDYVKHTDGSTTNLANVNLVNDKSKDMNDETNPTPYSSRPYKKRTPGY